MLIVVLKIDLVEIMEVVGIGSFITTGIVLLLLAKHMIGKKGQL